MTDEQLNVFLELLAQLVESRAGTVKEAAELIRQSKPQ